MLMLPMLVCCTKEPYTQGDADLLYAQYATHAELTAARVRGFRVDDTTKVDVVILVADDSTAWAYLKEELDIRTSEGVTSWLGSIQQPQQRVKRGTYPLWRAMAVHEERTVAFYRVESAAQFDALREYQLNNMIDTDNI